MKLFGQSILILLGFVGLVGILLLVRGRTESGREKDSLGHAAYIEIAKDHILMNNRQGCDTIWYTMTGWPETLRVVPRESLEYHGKMDTNLTMRIYFRWHDAPLRIKEITR